MAVNRRDGRSELTFAGRLDINGAGSIWRQVIREVRRGGAVILDVRQVDYCDSAGARLLASAEAVDPEHVKVDGASAQLLVLLNRARVAIAKPGPVALAPFSFRHVGAAGLRVVLDSIAFLGEVTLAVIRLAARHKMLRWPDLLRQADQAGVKALPLVVLMGFLMGLILAFQSAIPMRRFGADLYVANLVSISLIRELGPLLSAVILAGRTGSAFAAEIGTMKVNQELDALTTMGIDPVTMLVLPRLFAAMLIMPALIIALNVAGMLGMAAVMENFGYPFVMITHQVQTAVRLSDLLGGLFKGCCFGAAVAVIGCQAGLSTGSGPRAVGLSATSAVVGGIVSIIVLDGAFALIFYRIGL